MYFVYIGVTAFSTFPSSVFLLSGLFRKFAKFRLVMIAPDSEL